MECQGPCTSLPALETRRCCIPMHTYLHRSHAHCTAPFTTSDIPNTFHDLHKCNYSLRKCHVTSIQAHASLRNCTQVCATAHKFAQHHTQVPKMHSSSAQVHSSSMQVHSTSAQSHSTPAQLHLIILAWLMANYRTTPICYSILNCAFEIVTSTSIYPLWSASLKFGW